MAVPVEIVEFPTDGKHRFKDAHQLVSEQPDCCHGNNKQLEQGVVYQYIRSVSVELFFGFFVA